MGSALLVNRAEPHAIACCAETFVQGHSLFQDERYCGLECSPVDRVRQCCNVNKQAGGMQVVDFANELSAYSLAGSVNVVNLDVVLKPTFHFWRESLALRRRSQ